jgi:Secretion system C-terminal sorting domain
VYRDALTWSHFVKVDSLLATEWSVQVQPSLTTAGAGCEFTFVEPLTNGHYLATGYDLLPGANPPQSISRVGVLVEIAPPLVIGDTIGRVVGRWTATDGYCLRGVIDSTGTGYFFGSSTTNRSWWGYNTFLMKYTGLGRPQPQNLCARPPVLGPATWQVQGGQPDSLLFTLEQATTTAGPRYGEVSRVTWDFGDGTPVQQGWQVQHTFASPQPVRVKVCVMNNLWCQTCTDLYPFGPVLGTPKEVAPLQVSVHPNPSADGRFVVRQVRLGATTLTVTDALGRVVWRGESSTAETLVDLSAAAAGVYVLRVQAPDGRTLTRKLVR